MNLLREAEVQAERAWKKYRTHRQACAVCTSIEADPTSPRVLCLIGSILRDAWLGLDDLRYDAPWAAVVSAVVRAIGGGS